MAFQLVSEDNFNILYTSPWAFEELDTSMLADDDIVSCCPNVEDLTVSKAQANLASRYPNIQTLRILQKNNLSHDDYINFRRLRHLITTNITLIPSPVGRNIHSLTLLSIENLLEHSTVYPNVKYLNLKEAEFMTLTIVTALVQHFSNLQSLECQLQPTNDYYDCLNVLLNGEYLPNLSNLKTNWIDKDTFCSDIQLWLCAKTPLKFRSTPFLGHCNNNWLTICL